MAVDLDAVRQVIGSRAPHPGDVHLDGEAPRRGRGRDIGDVALDATRTGGQKSL